MTLGFWFQDHVAEWDPPALAYTFHTAFVAPGAITVYARHVGAAALPAALLRFL